MSLLPPPESVAQKATCIRSRREFAARDLLPHRHVLSISEPS